jgi:hypothetical protein
LEISTTTLSSSDTKIWGDFNQIFFRVAGFVLLASSSNMASYDRWRQHRRIFDTLLLITVGFCLLIEALGSLPLRTSASTMLKMPFKHSSSRSDWCIRKRCISLRGGEEAAAVADPTSEHVAAKIEDFRNR